MQSPLAPFRSHSPSLSQSQLDASPWIPSLPFPSTAGLLNQRHLLTNRQLADLSTWTSASKVGRQRCSDKHLTTGSEGWGAKPRFAACADFCGINGLTVANFKLQPGITEHSVRQECTGQAPEEDADRRPLSLSSSHLGPGKLVGVALSQGSLS